MSSADINTKGRAINRPLVFMARLKSEMHKYANKLLNLSEQSEDKRRRELILMTLLLGLIGLSSIAFLSTLGNKIMLGQKFEGTSPVLMVGILAIIVVLYLLRTWNARLSAALFVLFFGVCGLIPLVVWGVILPQAILTCALVIIMAGILINSRAAFITMLWISASIMVITYLQFNDFIKADYTWLQHTIQYSDPLTFIATFAVIVLVTWLYNREIEKSLKRAKASEAALKVERDQLEVKVKERTRELELIQYQKTLELQRFAEFGRLTSGLIHDVANPLTAVSINLEQVGGPKSEEIEAAKLGVRFLEQYVQAARQQLHSTGELTKFVAVDEVRQVAAILEYKARQARVSIEIEGDGKVVITGDRAKFNQVIANLLANAVDAYADIQRTTNRKVVVSVDGTNEKLDIAVHDWGVGIGPTVLKRLFEPFYSTKKDGRGIGVGLVMTKEFVERDFGGTISARSNRKDGTVFTIVIPVRSHGRGRPARKRD